MYSNIEDYFQDFVDKRINEIIGVITDNNVDCANLYEHSNNISKILIDNLSEDDKQLFIKYEEMNNEIVSIILNDVYACGFKDGIRSDKILSDVKTMD